MLCLVIFCKLVDAASSIWLVYLETVGSRSHVFTSEAMSGFHLVWGNNWAARAVWLIIMSARCLSSNSGRCNHLPTDPLMLIYCPLSCPLSVILKGSLSGLSAPTYPGCLSRRSLHWNKSNGWLGAYCILRDVGNQMLLLTKLGNVA